MSIRRFAAPILPILALATLLGPPAGRLAAQEAYRTPPPDVVDILDAPPLPPGGDESVR